MNTAIDLKNLIDLREFHSPPSNDNGAPNVSLTEFFEHALGFVEMKRIMIKEMILEELKDNASKEPSDADTIAEKVTELYLSIYIDQIKKTRKDLLLSIKKDPLEIEVDWEVTTGVTYDMDVNWIKALCKVGLNLENIDPQNVDTVLIERKGIIQKRLIKAGLYDNGQKIREMLENCGVSLD